MFTTISRTLPRQLRSYSSAQRSYSKRQGLQSQEEIPNDELALPSRHQPPRVASREFNPPLLKSNPYAGTYSLKAEQPVDHLWHKGRLKVEPNFTASSTSLQTRWGHISWPRLRDACACDQCVHSSTKQKTRTSGESARVSAPTCRPFKNGLEIIWQDHRSTYSNDILHQLSSPAQTPLQNYTRRFWDNSTFRLATYEYANYKQNMLDLLRNLHVEGMVKIQGVPTNKTDDKVCALRKVMETFGPMRNTFYGETWDVMNIKDSKNVAYTNLNLGLHMDLLYFSNPPRFQALHCLRNRVDGGESYFVDAFMAVRLLRQKYPQSARILNDVGIEFEYDNDNHLLRFRHPLFSQDLQDTHAAVNWSPPFQAMVRSIGDIHAEREYYQALHHFDLILQDPSLKYEFLLQEGDLIIFDNRRLLHARRAFKELSEEERELRQMVVHDGEPSRWLKGCYTEGEVIWDKLGVLSRQNQASL